MKQESTRFKSPFGSIYIQNPFSIQTIQEKHRLRGKRVKVPNIWVNKTEKLVSACLFCSCSDEAFNRGLKARLERENEDFNIDAQEWKKRTSSFICVKA